MHGRFEFRFHELPAAGAAIDAALAGLGAEGWEIRGVCSAGEMLVVALQRSLSATTQTAGQERLAESAAIVANLDEPLVAPTAEDLDVPA